MASRYAFSRFSSAELKGCAVDTGRGAVPSIHLARILRDLDCIECPLVVVLTTGVPMAVVTRNPPIGARSGFVLVRSRSALATGPTATPIADPTAAADIRHERRCPRNPCASMCSSARMTELGMPIACRSTRLMAGLRASGVAVSALLGGGVHIHRRRAQMREATCRESETWRGTCTPTQPPQRVHKGSTAGPLSACRPHLTYNVQPRV
jgi:hypothetical protein